MWYVRWSITATAKIKGNTVNKENLTNQTVLLTYKKDLLPFEQDLLTHTKTDPLKYAKNPRQTAKANFSGK